MCRLQIKVLVVYLCMGLVSLILGTIAVRAVVAFTTWLLAGRALWLLPNALSDVRGSYVSENSRRVAEIPLPHAACCPPSDYNHYVAASHATAALFAGLKRQSANVSQQCCRTPESHQR